MQFMRIFFLSMLYKMFDLFDIFAAKFPGKNWKVFNIGQNILMLYLTFMTGFCYGVIRDEGSAIKSLYLIVSESEAGESRLRSGKSTSLFF